MIKYFGVFLSLILIVSLIPNVIAPPEFSDQDKYNAAHVIITGKIISFSKPDPLSHQLTSTDTIYEVKVDKYIKNPLGKEILYVIAHGGPDAEEDPMGSTVSFDVGDNVYLYLRENGDMYRVDTVTSYRISSPCEPIPKELSHLTDKPSSWEFQTLDSNHNEKQIFAAGEKILIRFDATNTQPETRTMTYDIIIHDGKKKDERTVYYTDSKEITLPSCVGHTILEWSFTPTEEHDYFVDVRSDGRGTGFGIPVTMDGNPSNYYDVPIKPTPILKQFREHISENDLQCHKKGTTLAFKIDGSPACITPNTLAKLLQRGWVAEKRYIPLPDMNISGKPNYDEMAFDAAHKFLESSKTFAFDGTKRNGGFANLAHTNETPPTYLLDGNFGTETTGYGDRENQDVQEVKTPHRIVLKVRGSDVIYAVIDNQWDEINQKFIAHNSESFKDFEVHYQKFFGEEQRDYTINLDSRSGIMRIYDTPNDTFYVVNHLEFEKFWSAILENEFFDLTYSNNECESCITNTIKIESGGTHNTVSWGYSDTLDERLVNIISALEKMTQNKDDSWPT